MKICIITSSFPSHPTDVAHAPFLIPFIEGLKNRGHQVFLFTQDRKGEKKEVLEGVEVKRFPWMKSESPLVQLNPLHPFDFFRIVNLFYNGRKSLLPFIREKKIDVCLALWIIPSGYFAYYACQKANIPYSVWALGSDIYRYGGIPLLHFPMKKIITEAKGVFADGCDLAKRMEDRFGRAVTFLPTTRPLENRIPDKPNQSNQPYRFLFVGRLDKVKGIDLLLQSMALLLGERTDVHLTIVGRGGLEKWLKGFIEQRGLGGQIEWVGNVSDPRLASLYVSSDCVVIPSRSESIPVVFSEALHFNKTLIVTDVGDMGMLGRKYGIAWVVPPEDPLALKEIMEKRVESQDHPQIGGDGGKREALKRLFNIETSVERFLEDYK